MPNPLKVQSSHHRRSFLAHQSLILFFVPVRGVERHTHSFAPSVQNRRAPCNRHSLPCLSSEAARTGSASTTSGAGQGGSPSPRLVRTLRHPRARLRPPLKAAAVLRPHPPPLKDPPTIPSHSLTLCPLPLPRPQLYQALRSHPKRTRSSSPSLCPSPASSSSFFSWPSSTGSAAAPDSASSRSNSSVTRRRTAMRCPTGRACAMKRGRRRRSGKSGWSVRWPRHQRCMSCPCRLARRGCTGELQGNGEAVRAACRQYEFYDEAMFR